MSAHFIAAVAFRSCVRVACLLWAGCLGIAPGQLTCTAAEGNRVSGRALVGDEKLKALEMIVAQMKANYERIQTLQGSYRFDDRFQFAGHIPGNTVNIAEDLGPDESGPSAGPLNNGEIPVGAAVGGGYWEITRGLAKFSLDLEAMKYHVFYTPNMPVGFIDVATGRESRWRTLGDSIHWIFTPAHALEFNVAHTRSRIDEYPPVATVPPRGGRVIYKRTVEEGKRYTRILERVFKFKMPGLQGHFGIMLAYESPKMRLRLRSCFGLTSSKKLI